MYLKGNDKYEAQFKIDFKQIAKEMDFNAGDARIANIHYFNKDYVVLYISYHGKPIGTAGSVNYIIFIKIMNISYPCIARVKIHLFRNLFEVNLKLSFIFFISF